MVTPSSGSVILVPFPFSDLSRSKLRPALVIAYTGRDDWILCQITSKPYGDDNAIMIADGDFLAGSLKVTSYVRPGRLFTANVALMVVEVGRLSNNVLVTVVEAIERILHSGIKR